MTDEHLLIHVRAVTVSLPRRRPRHGRNPLAQSKREATESAQSAQGDGIWDRVGFQNNMDQGPDRGEHSGQSADAAPTVETV